jgi:replication factor C subunit 3/5
MSHSE